MGSKMRAVEHYDCDEYGKKRLRSIRFEKGSGVRQIETRSYIFLRRQFINNGIRMGLKNPLEEITNILELNLPTTPLITTGKQQEIYVRNKTAQVL